MIIKIKIPAALDGKKEQKVTKRDGKRHSMLDPGKYLKKVSLVWTVAPLQQEALLQLNSAALSE